MYFNNQIKFDPSSSTEIIAIPPTKAFKRMLNFLTAGHLSEKEEHETYTAISILQQLNVAMRKIGVNNIVRLSKDETDFYFYHEGKQNDLKEALEAFELKIDQVESGVFKTLELVLEHEDQNFMYLIDVKISRIHPVGEYPIEIHVNGLIKDFKSNEKNADQLKAKLENELFRTPEEYETYMKHKMSHFDAFATRLQWEFKTILKCDAVEHESKQKLLRPNKKSSNERADASYSGSDAVYHGYHGFDDYFFYTFMWADLMHTHHIPCHDCTIVSDVGETLMEVGTEGFDAGTSDILNTDTELVPDERAMPDVGDTSDSSSFFDSVGSFFDGGDSSSSCSSCSSCGGGGCGGGCGGG